MINKNTFRHLLSTNRRKSKTFMQHLCKHKCCKRGCCLPLNSNAFQMDHLLSLLASCDFFDRARADFGATGNGGGTSIKTRTLKPASNKKRLVKGKSFTPGCCGLRQLQLNNRKKLNVDSK